MPVRVGQGFDVHRFSDDADRPLVLGGVDVSRGAGAATATAMPMPSRTPRPTHCSGPPGWAISASTSPTPTRPGPVPTRCGILAARRRMVRAAGWEIGNVDVSVVCETPKLAPHRAAMERNLSDAVAAPR